MATQRAFEIIAAACKAVIPAGGITVSQWADANRVLSAEASSEPGRWRTSRVPYAREWMDTVNDPYVHTVVMMTSSQVAKSETLNNVCGYFIHHDPCPILLIQPTIDRMKDYSTKRIAPMIRDTPVLAAVVADENSRSGENTKLSKSFVGGHLLMTGANAASGLASNPIRVVLADEIDRYPQDVDNEGDPLSLAIVRTRTFTNRKIVITSTPTNKGESRIEDEYENTDKRRYYVPCPHCHEKQLLKFREDESYRLMWEVDPDDDSKVTSVWYSCINGCEIEPHHKLRMLDEGEWVAEKPHVGRVGFHINALYSVWYSWKEIAEDFISASKAAKAGKPEKLKVFVNTTLGETWDASLEKSDIIGLENRAEEYEATAPLGVLYITAGVDVQPDRLECEITGWGIGFESWSLDYLIFYGNTNEQQVWSELEAALTKDFECEREDSTGTRLVRTVDAACIDSAGHNTQAVYKFTRAHAGNKFLAIIGRSTGIKEVISKRPSRLKGGVFLYTVGVSLIKDTLFGYLQVQDTGPGYCHFPGRHDVDGRLVSSYDIEYFKQLTAEKKVKKIKKFDKHDPHGYSQWQYKKIRSRNEALDCRVYALAALLHLNPNFERVLTEENLHCAKKTVSIDNSENTDIARSYSITSKQGHLGGFVSSWQKR